MYDIFLYVIVNFLNIHVQIMHYTLLFYSFRCVALKEYMTTDLDKYHCPRCEAMCGPSLSKAIVLNILCIFPN